MRTLPGRQSQLAQIVAQAMTPNRGRNQRGRGLPGPTAMNSHNPGPGGHPGTKAFVPGYQAPGPIQPVHNGVGPVNRGVGRGQAQNRLTPEAQLLAQKYGQDWRQQVYGRNYNNGTIANLKDQLAHAGNAVPSVANNQLDPRAVAIKRRLDALLAKRAEAIASFKGVGRNHPVS